MCFDVEIAKCYLQIMSTTRTHAQIISDGGSDAEVALKLSVKNHQARDWRIRCSIPPERWASLAQVGLASADELAASLAEHGRKVGKHVRAA